jgi:Sensors of blue-light using FAD
MRMTENGTEPTFHLIYRSRNRIPRERRRQEFGAIFSVARANNKKVGVSGALLISDDWFVQVLEGPEPVVRALYEQICMDARHERISLIDSGSTGERVFARWAMAKVAEDGAPDIPLLNNVDKGGISPAAPRATTPEQQSLLDVMRAAIHGESHAV